MPPEIFFYVMDSGFLLSQFQKVKIFLISIKKINKDTSPIKMIKIITFTVYIDLTKNRISNDKIYFRYTHS